MNTETNSQTDQNNNNAAEGEQGGNQEANQETGDRSQDQTGEQGSEQDKSTDEGDRSQEEDKGKSEEDKGKSEEEGKAEDKGKEDDEPEPLGAPEAYRDFKVPDGYTMDDEQQQRVNGFARKIDLNNTQRDEMIQFHTEILAELDHAKAEAHKQQRKDWVEQTKTDPEFAGSHYDEKMSIAKKGMNMFSEPAVYEEDWTDSEGKEFKKGDPILDKDGLQMSRLQVLADQTGLGDHPEFNRAMYRAGKLIRPDTIIGGMSNPGGSQGKTQAETMFPNQGKK